LIAKVIATGTTREEARSRLVCALGDLDLVIEGGATNTGYLIDVLDAAEFRRGGVDTGWIDRRRREATSPADRDASDALVGAAILAYQRRRRDAGDGRRRAGDARGARRRGTGARIPRSDEGRDHLLRADCGSGRGDPRHEGAARRSRRPARRHRARGRPCDGPRRSGGAAD